MSQGLEAIGEQMELIALETVTLEGGDIRALGKIMNGVETLEGLSEQMDQPAFNRLLGPIKQYIKKLILFEEDDIKPLEEGISCLQNIYHAVIRGETFNEETSPVLNKLKVPGLVSDKENQKETGADESDQDSRDQKPDEVRELNEEDREILSDFVSESLENLASIEVNLIDLEDDPENLEAINAIFRPFHTIKGVSGFLHLDKINKLAHGSENLLDKARDGDIKIEGNVVDLVLESVDTLKYMIQEVEDGLDQGTVLETGPDIKPLLEKIETFIARSDAISGMPLGEILVEDGVISKDSLEEGLKEQEKKQGEKIGRILVEEGAAAPKEVVGALRSQKKFGGKRALDVQIKVDTKKLDTLVDMSGELVIAQAMLRQNESILSLGDQKLYKNLNQLNQITSTLQKTAMALRMVPIGSTFKKMVRLVRDLAKNSGKQVSLAMEGEDTEIDRNVVDELYEPMVHMIRNAVDHGIEAPETRKANGKPANGSVSLRAYHRGGNIVIEIEDDGKGLDKERILEKAKTNKMITEESGLSDSEIYNLIFQPGFSTAKEITDVSGRGVGMDVVKKSIEKLRGRVEINSVQGRGSIFTINLPLTLAIIEGMVVKVGQERYIIPALAILESLRPEKDQCSTVKGKGEMVLVRGKLIPLIRLDRVVGTKGKCQVPWEGLVVAVEYEGRQMCLLLDELLGKEEVVIKSLGESLKHIKGLAGGAIMGDGRVGLILDIAGLFDIAREDY